MLEYRDIIRYSLAVELLQLSGFRIIGNNRLWKDLFVRKRFQVGKEI